MPTLTASSWNCTAHIFVVLTLACSSAAQNQLSAQYLSAEYEPAKTLISDTSSTSGSTVFTLKIAHPDHCSQMEVAVVGMIRQSPNVVIMGPSDVGTMFTINDDPTAPSADCQFTVPGTFVWEKVNVRRSPSAAASYVVTKKVKADGAPNQTKSAVFVLLRPFATAFAQPGAFQGSFKYSPGLNGSVDQISTDVDFSPAWPVAAQWWLGISERYKYDSRPNQNPDALISSLTLQGRSQKCSWYSSTQNMKCPIDGLSSAPAAGLTIRPLQFDARLLSFEYAPAAAYSNLVSSGRVGLPFVLTIHHQPSALTFTPSLGIDGGASVFGSPISHVPTFIFRGTPGGDASLRISYEKLTKYLDKKPITISAKYRAYIPARDELLTTFPSTAKAPIFTLSSQTRHFAQSDVSIPLTKYVTAGLSYSFGSLPPSFRQFDHNIQISIKAQSQGDYEH